MSKIKKTMIFIFLMTMSLLLISCDPTSNKDFVAPTFLRMEVDDKDFVTYDKENKFPILATVNNDSAPLSVTIYLENSQKRMISSVIINGLEITYDKFVENTDNQIIKIEYRFDKDKIREVEEIEKAEDRVLALTVEKIFYKKGANSVPLTLTANNMSQGIVNPKYTLTILAPTADNTNKTYVINDVSYKDDMRFVLPDAGDANTAVDSDKLFKRDSKLEAFYTLPDAKGEKISTANKYFFNKDMTLYAHFVQLFVYEEKETYIKITDLTLDGSRETALLVPDFINDMPVLEIGAGAFKKFGGVVVNLNKTLNVIGEQAFFNLNKTNVNFEKATLLEEIGDEAFSGCTKLNSMEFLPSLKRIGKYAFEKCGWSSKRPAGTGSSGNLQSTLIIPNTIESIGEGAFSRSTFTKVFFRSRNLDETGLGIVPLILGNNVFEKCSYLNTVRFGTTWNASGQLIDTMNNIDEIKLIPEKAFFECVALSSVYMPNNSVQKIEKSAFAKCTALSEFTLPNSLQEIGVEAFAGCEQLAEIKNTKNSELLSIGDYAFMSCISLTEVYINSDKLKTWGKAPFYGATRLQSIFLEASSPTFDGDSGQVANPYLKYYVKEEYIQHYIDKWKVKENWQGQEMEVLKFFSFSTIIEIQEGTKKTRYAIKEINTAGDITIELLTIFTKETVLDIPSNLPLKTGSSYKYPVTILGSFLAHSGLTAVKIPDTIVEIKSSAFFECKSLASVNRLDNLEKLTKLEKIGDMAFIRTSITKVITPRSLKEIGYRAFNGCSKLLEVKIFTDVEIQIKEEAFSGSLLSKTHLGENVISIGKGAFSITSVNDIYLYGTPPTLDALTTPWAAERVTVFVKQEHLTKYQEAPVYKDNKNYKIF